MGQAPIDGNAWPSHRHGSDKRRRNAHTLRDAVQFYIGVPKE